MNFSRISRVLLMALITVLALGLMVTGCGKKAPVETEPQVAEQPIEDVPETPVAEDPTPAETVIDYANLNPSDFGVEDIFFDFDQYDLDAEAMGLLSGNARVLREADVTILIAGHCDERGTIEYNLALGEKRANAVRDYLISLGVPARQLRVTSYGENKPFAKGSDEDAWALNRRAHFARP